MLFSVVTIIQLYLYGSPSLKPLISLANNPVSTPENERRITYICFYQVVSLHGKSTVRIRRIAGQPVTGNWRDGCKPAQDHFIDDPLPVCINIRSGKPPPELMTVSGLIRPTRIKRNILRHTIKYGIT